MSLLAGPDVPTGASPDELTADQLLILVGKVLVVEKVIIGFNRDNNVSVGHDPTPLVLDPR